MTSGNLLYKQVRPFNNFLFIDHVDHEYGMRLYSKKFRVIELNNVHTKRMLGVKKQIRLFGALFSFVSHSPQRMYYMSRNDLYVSQSYIKKYPMFVLTMLKLFTKEIIKTIFLKIINFCAYLILRKA